MADSIRQFGSCTKQAGFLILAAALTILSTAVTAKEPQSTVTTIRVDTKQPVASFVPSEAFGAGIDGQGKGDVAKIYQESNLKEFASAPFHRLSYRLRTELGIEVWHWNEVGSWSDPKNQQGYWTSSDKPGEPILISHGYRLPRRGNTIDQANNDGYSRLSDGDEKSFWKSNPYLDKHFTGEDNAKHPQWVLIDFEKAVNIQALRIAWGEPYATRYEIQYWDGEDAEHYHGLRNGHWRAFPKGRIEDGAGGDEILRLAEAPVRVRYIKIVLQQASGTAPEGASDVRDRLGFAIREIYAGALGGDGKLLDWMQHGTSNKTQTKILTSSTDPWHRAVDLDLNTEQPGLDLIMTSGLTRDRPMLTPTGLLYDTPDNAAAEIRYLKARGYKVNQIELGEEPDGQHVAPEHYGALYIQFTDAIRKVDSSLKTGGPGFQSEVDGWDHFLNVSGNYSWMKRFLAYLRERQRVADFGFFSFEWYPFDEDVCSAATKHLRSHPQLVRQTIQRLAEDGVPKDIPWIITEYGWSSYAKQAEVELPAALLNAEIAAQFVMAGIKTAYVYGLEPSVPSQEAKSCGTWGNLMMYRADAEGRAKWRLPTYYGAKLITEQWVGQPDALHTLFRVAIGKDEGEDGDVTAYAVRQPNELWAVMILNKSASQSQTVQIQFEGDREESWRGPLDVFQYSPKQYSWLSNRKEGHPTRSEPPETKKIAAGRPALVELPPMSLTVVRGSRLEINRPSSAP